MEVLLVGNPNTGKTTLFNTLTKSSEHTGNWHGVTIGEKAKTYSYKGQNITLVDLPGIYSLSPHSYEEEVSCRYISEHLEDVVICTCDLNNLRRNLYLVLCLLERKKRVIMVVNQIGQQYANVDFSLLSQKLGIQVIVIDGRDKEDCEKINKALIVQQKYNFNEMEYFDEVDFSPVEKWRKKLETWELISLLEDNPYVKEKHQIVQDFCLAPEIAKLRYEYVDRTLAQCGFRQMKSVGKSALDKLLLNKFLALPWFFVVLGMVFFLTFFSVGKALSVLLEKMFSCFLFDPLSSGLHSLFGSQSWVCLMFDNAICGAVGMVASFLPQVGILMLCLTLLEESGYLSRVAFLFDDLLSKVGLSGKAVYAMLMGFGCSTTAVLSARTMEDRNAKIKTALLCPYFSCSAKFPIYAVIGGALFGARNIWVIMGLYLLGLVIALVVSCVFERTVLKSKKQSFLLEFPSYRMMSLKQVFLSLWHACKTFISKVGGVIIVMNIVLWFFSNFSFTFSFVGQNGENALRTFGRLIAPVFTPLGFGSWAIASSLIAGIFAKEVIVSSIALFNGVEGLGLVALQSSVVGLSSLCSFANYASVLSFLCFALLYFPCVSTILVMKKEIGVRWTFVGCVVQFIVAYAVAFFIFNITYCCELFGFVRVFIFLLSLLCVAVSFVYAYRKMRQVKCPYAENCKKKCKKK